MLEVIRDLNFDFVRHYITLYEIRFTYKINRGQHKIHYTSLLNTSNVCDLLGNA